ncbi:hypothetical protein IKS57_05610 [bacterium]|nr:hypothetical protein [bacterium]
MINMQEWKEIHNTISAYNSSSFNKEALYIGIIKLMQSQMNRLEKDNKKIKKDINKLKKKIGDLVEKVED